MAAVDKRLLELYASLHDDFRLFGREVLRVRNKLGNTVPFVMNHGQEILHDKIEKQKQKTGRVRMLVPKSRQVGVSTYTGGRFYHNTTMNRGRNTYILAHEQSASDALFGIVDRYHKNDPLAPHVGAANVRELVFDRIDSSYTVSTAGSKAGGRGKSMSNFHGCLSPDTWIMDPRGGARRMRDFRVGDSVFTHTGAVAQISFISRKYAEAYALRVMGANEPIVATGEHKFVTRRGKVALSELKVGDELMHPVATLGEGPETFEMGRCLGLYLAEGHQTRNRIVFVVHEREVERTLEWLKPLQNMCKSAPKVRRRKSKAVAIEIDSKRASEYVLERCGRVENKHLPENWQDSRNFARGLVVGYFSGDGGGQFDKTTRRVQAPSIRSAISFGMRDALAALGYGWASLVRREGALRGGRSEKTQWTVRLSGAGADALWADMGREPLPRTRKVRDANFKIEDGAAWFPITEIEPVGEAEVMDFEVAHKDHTYRTWQCATSNSEVAFWPNAADHFAASVQTVPDMDGTEIILESTANGVTGEFYERVQDAIQGRGDYDYCFIPWYVMPEYSRRVPEDFELSRESDGSIFTEEEYMEMFGLSLEQMVWRRNKIYELRSASLFDQEYPANVELAFQQKAEGAYHDASKILRARKRENVVAAGPLILGVDPAGEGGDRFAIAFRRGYVVEKVVWRDKIDHLEAVEWLKSLIDEHDPAVVFIDAGGIGRPVISTLRAKGPRYNLPFVRAVNFGATSQQKMARPNMPGPKNRRAEMQLRLKEWLELEEGVSIPDIDALQADLINVRIKPSLTNDLQLMSKQDMRKLGLRSPDLADALGLTFADLTFIREYKDRPKRPTFMQDAAPSIIAPSDREIDQFGGADWGDVGQGWMG